VVGCDFRHVHVTQLGLKKETAGFVVLATHNFLMSPLFVYPRIILGLLLHILFGVVEEEDICRLDVTVHDSQLMHGAEPIYSFNEHTPHLALSEVHLHPLALENHLEQVAGIRILHHDAQQLILGVDKCLLVLDDVGVAYR